MAVAGTVAAPVAVQAGADELYASARIGLESYDTGGVSDLRVRSLGSRFGARGETDLGNGMTGFGRYEWDVDFDDHSEDADNDIDLRHRYVGLKGGFGSVLVGQTYHTFYNFTVAPVDIPWWSSGYAMVDYVGRTGYGITYAGGTGAIAFGATGYFGRDSEEDSPDVLELGASFGIGDMTLGVAMRTTEADQDAGTGLALIGNSSDEDVIGVALSGVSFGDVSMSFAYQSQDDDDGLVAHVDIGNIYVHFETESLDAADQDPSMVTLGYTQSLGRKTTMYYEFMEYDADSDNSDDDITAARAVLKYDII
jgi:predicted porin